MILWLIILIFINKMNEIQFQKHSRRTALAVYSDFKIHKSDEDLLKRMSTEEDSTLITRSTQSPSVCQTQQIFSDLMESIMNRFKLMNICKEEKKRVLKTKILSLLFNESKDRLPRKKSKAKIIIDEFSPKKKTTKKKIKKDLKIRSTKTSKDLKILDFPFLTQRSVKNKSMKFSSKN